MAIVSRSGACHGRVTADVGDVTALPRPLNLTTTIMESDNESGAACM